MDETQTLLRQIFQTENRVTFPLSASGSGGIEAAVLKFRWNPATKQSAASTAHFPNGCT